jgi:hypothetical protein
VFGGRTTPLLEAVETTVDSFRLAAQRAAS